MEDDLAGVPRLNRLTLAPAVRKAPKIGAIVDVDPDGDDLGPQAPRHPSVFEEGVRASLFHQEIDVAQHRVAGPDLVRDIHSMNYPKQGSVALKIQQNI